MKMQPSLLLQSKSKKLKYFEKKLIQIFSKANFRQNTKQAFNSVYILKMYTWTEKQSSCLQSVFNFYYEKKVQDWTGRLSYHLWTPVVARMLNVDEDWTDGQQWDCS
jgi:hypothetical protein